MSIITYQRIKFKEDQEGKQWSHVVTLIHPASTDYAVELPSVCTFCSEGNHIKGGQKAFFVLAILSVKQIMNWHARLPHGQIGRTPPFDSTSVKVIGAAANLADPHPVINALESAGCIETKMAGRDKLVWLTPLGLSRWVCLITRQALPLVRHESETTLDIDLSQ